jgi:RNA polymerase sigma-70 factor, ECF subfamily
VDVERRLVELARRGDQEAFGEIAFAISPRLFAVAHRILRDFHRAEDATQQAIVLIWRDLPKLTDPDRFDAWAYRVLVNACYAEARSRRRVPDGLHLLPTDAVSGDSQASVADRDMLQRAFDRLPADQRSVLVLQYYLDMGHHEIAEVLGVPIGTVKSRASGARSALRAVLEADARSSVAGRTA